MPLTLLFHSTVPRIPPVVGWRASFECAMVPFVFAQSVKSHPTLNNHTKGRHMQVRCPVSISKFTSSHHGEARTHTHTHTHTRIRTRTRTNARTHAYTYTHNGSKENLNVNDFVNSFAYFISQHSCHHFGLGVGGGLRCSSLLPSVFTDHGLYVHRS